MGTWVLILIIYSGTHGVAITQVDFLNKEDCERAARYLDTITKDAFCIKKS